MTRKPGSVWRPIGKKPSCNPTHSYQTIYLSTATLQCFVCCAVLNDSQYSQLAQMNSIDMS